jgi:hypothetical protein
MSESRCPSGIRNLTLQAAFFFLAAGFFAAGFLAAALFARAFAGAFAGAFAAAFAGALARARLAVFAGAFLVVVLVVVFAFTGVLAMESSPSGIVRIDSNELSMCNRF